MTLKDLEFLIPATQPVEIIEFDRRLDEIIQITQIPWFKVSGLNREIINIVALKDKLILEVKSVKDKS